jgi:RHS repeat-associated protein
MEKGCLFFIRMAGDIELEVRFLAYWKRLELRVRVDGDWERRQRGELPKRCLRRHLIEERVDDNWTSGFTADRNLQNLWGIRYIDDIVMHREDHDGDGSFSDAGTLRWWHLTDAQFSTIANLDDAATLQERVMYDSYGRALHRDDKDVDGDRDFDSTDRGIVNTLSSVGPGGTLITASTYDADADMDRDGDVDSTDLTLIGTSYISALAAGKLSNSTVKNTIGWDGYVFNGEVSGAGLYKIRTRWYSPELGRWLERDIRRLLDDRNLYHYTANNPLIHLDPSGRAAESPIDDEDDEAYKAYRDFLLGQLKDIFEQVAGEVTCEIVDITRFDITTVRKFTAISQTRLTIEILIGDQTLLIDNVRWDMLHAELKTRITSLDIDKTVCKPLEQACMIFDIAISIYDAVERMKAIMDPETTINLLQEYENFIREPYGSPGNPQHGLVEFTTCLTNITGFDYSTIMGLFIAYHIMGQFPGSTGPEIDPAVKAALLRSIERVQEKLRGCKCEQCVPGDDVEEGAEDVSDDKNIDGSDEIVV